MDTAPPPSPATPDLSAAASDLARDGATVLRSVIPAEWITRMAAAVDAELADPSPTAARYGEDGRFFGDFFLWRRNPEFRAFALDSPLPELAAGLMGSARAHLFYDQLFVKEPGAVGRTPWHQDLPYWPVEGDQVLSIWVPFDRVGPGNGVVTYVRGSHLAGKIYRPEAFDPKNAGAFAASPHEPMPDIEADPLHFPLISWSLEPGDVLVHLGLVIHGAPGNASSDQRRRALAVRYTGDDARFSARPGTFLEMDSVRRHVPAPGLAPGDSMGGPLFPQAWPREADGGEGPRRKRGA